MTIPSEIYQNSGEVDIVFIFVATNYFGVMIDNIVITNGFTGEAEVDLFG